MLMGGAAASTIPLHGEGYFKGTMRSPDSTYQRPLRPMEFIQYCAINESSARALNRHGSCVCVFPLPDAYVISSHVYNRGNLL